MNKAIKEYKMIEAGDKIAIGISGGKDSLMLLNAMALYQKYAKIQFEIVAVAVDIFGNTDFSKIEQFCKDLNVKFYVEKTNIKQVVFDIRKEKSPCSLCAKLRRGCLNSKAVELGCNKVCLGHHADDFIQTFFMSLTKENRLSTFWPVSYLSNTNLYVIRPFLYVWEKMIEEKKNLFPIIENNCPANKKTERENVKIIIENLENVYPNFKHNLLESLTKTERYNLLDKSKKLIQNNENKSE